MLPFSLMPDDGSWTWVCVRTLSGIRTPRFLPKDRESVDVSPTPDPDPVAASGSGRPEIEPGNSLWRKGLSVREQSGWDAGIRAGSR
jgi:hypothetical protein